MLTVRIEKVMLLTYLPFSQQFLYMMVRTKKNQPVVELSSERESKWDNKRVSKVWKRDE
jgi:hypothetical protein